MDVYKDTKYANKHSITINEAQSRIKVAPKDFLLKDYLALLLKIA